MIPPLILRFTSYAAQALRAGGGIVVLGGHWAERTANMMATTHTPASLPVPEDIDSLDEKLIELVSDLDSLFGSVTRRLIDSFENETIIPNASWEYVGRFTYETDELVDTLELLLERAKELRGLRVVLARTAQNDGLNPDAPTLDAHYGQYRISPEALKRWGLSDA